MLHTYIEHSITSSEGSKGAPQARALPTFTAQNVQISCSVLEILAKVYAGAPKSPEG